MLTGKTYVMTPIVNYETPGYRKSKVMLQHQYPTAEFLWPDTLFSSNLDWLINFPHYLQASDCGLVIPDRQGMVGSGVYAEYKAFLKTGKPVYCLNNIRITTDFALQIINKNDRQRYARVIVETKAVIANERA